MNFRMIIIFVLVYLKKMSYSFGIIIPTKYAVIYTKIDQT